MFTLSNVTGETLRSLILNPCWLRNDDSERVKEIYRKREREREREKEKQRQRVKVREREIKRQKERDRKRHCDRE